ncbi:hypothetical protein VNO77_34081 [Canavalia gladiata]|uniref:Uncharacterized protein n=1 Tax=Canavalia gladiata TaxID=3824 RepID=A0AAN9PWY7_CANGL
MRRVRTQLLEVIGSIPSTRPSAWFVQPKPPGHLMLGTHAYYTKQSLWEQCEPILVQCILPKRRGWILYIIFRNKDPPVSYCGGYIDGAWSSSMKISRVRSHQVLAKNLYQYGALVQRPLGCFQNAHTSFHLARVLPNRTHNVALNGSPQSVLGFLKQELVYSHLRTFCFLSLLLIPFVDGGA